LEEQLGKEEDWERRRIRTGRCHRRRSKDEHDHVPPVGRAPAVLLDGKISVGPRASHDGLPDVRAFDRGIEALLAQIQTHFYHVFLCFLVELVLFEFVFFFLCFLFV
jgi:hypothetical protein